MKTLEHIRFEKFFKFLIDNGIEHTEIWDKAKETLYLFEEYNLYDSDFKKDIDEALTEPFKMVLITGNIGSGKTTLLKYMADKFTRKLSAIKDLASIDEMHVFDGKTLEKWQVEKYNSLAIDNLETMEDLSKLMNKFTATTPKTLFVVGTPQMLQMHIWHYHLKINKGKWGNYDGKSIK